jgi:DNA repair exonuclease SbcCD ATPase subunit
MGRVMGSEDDGVSAIDVYELPDWFAKQTEDLLFNYRADIQKQMDRIEEALVASTETAEQLLVEVVVDGEMTVPGAAAKLANRIKSLFDSIEFPEEITYASVEELLQDLEGYIREITMAGQRYIRRLPKVHKRVVKELDYQFRTISQGYQKIRKIWEKDKVPKQLDQIREEVEEIEDRSRQLVKLSEDLEALKKQQEKAEGRVEKHQDGIEQFRQDSGLVEIEKIRREIDSIRMIVTNQLNFLKKPFKKLSQAAGQKVMISSTAGEGADAYSADPWKAFQRDTETLALLKAGLNALADAIEGRKLTFKARIDRKIGDFRTQVIGKGTLDEYRLRFSSLESRKNELKSSVSVDKRRELEKSLERAKWEKRDVTAEITHIEEQMDRVSDQLRTLQKQLEKSLSSILRGDVKIDFPEEVNALLGQDLIDES